MKVLVTGSEGFIGSHLVERLLDDGHTVRALVLYNSFGSAGWLEDVRSEEGSGLEICFGNVEDPKCCETITKDVDLVFNLAALIGIPYSYEAPMSYISTNVIGCKNMLEASLRNNVAKFVQMSTSEVYGSAQEYQMSEFHPISAQSPYAASKIGADSLATAYHRSFGLTTRIARPFNTFGPRQSRRAIVPEILCQALAKDFVVLGNVHSERDFNFVADVVDGLVRVGFFDGDEIDGMAVNIGSGFVASISEIVSRVSKILQKDIEIRIDESRQRPPNSEVNRLCCDATKARTLLGWQEKFSGSDGLDLGIEITAEWIIKNSEKSMRSIQSPSRYFI